MSGILAAFPTRDGLGSLSRFDEPDGSFGFRLTDLRANAFLLGEVGPGDTLEFTYRDFAQASTGFGETGIFAAIGDPFKLNAGGAHVDIVVGDATPADGVPESATLATLGLGLVVVGISARWRRRHR